MELLKSTVQEVVVLRSEESEGTLATLQSAGFRCRACEDVTALLSDVQDVGVLIIAGESLLSNLDSILEVMAGQPPWSDLPVILLVDDGQAEEVEPLHEYNVTIVNRPVPYSTLLSIVRSALRARDRQHEMRRNMERLENGVVALRESEARFRNSIESILDAVGIYRAIRDEMGAIVDFHVEYANEVACRLNGMAREELVGQRLLDVLPAHRESGLFEAYQKVVETGEPLLWEAPFFEDSGDGRRMERAFDLRAARFGDGFIASWHDATARRRTRTALEQERQDLEARVARRTAELTYTNAILEEQIEVRERIEDQLVQRNKQLSTLNRITGAASQTLELSGVLKTIEELLSSELEVEGGVIFFYNETGKTLTRRHSWGLPLATTAHLGPFAVNNTPFAPVVQQQETVFGNNLQELALYTRWGLTRHRPDWRSFLAVPLLAQRHVQGVFCLFSTQDSFTQEQQAFYTTLGQQVGVVINNARLYAEVQVRGERLQQLTQRIITVQEEERQRVSHELHDEAGQALTALMLSLEMTRASLPADFEEARRSISAAVELTGETMEQIRMLAYDLRTPSLDMLGLGPTLAGLCNDFSKRTNLEITYEGKVIPRLPGSIAISLYRVAQEGLANVARHANAEKVAVKLLEHQGIIVLSIADDGRGFDVERGLYEGSRGVGLSGLQERMETLGGWLEIDSQPEKGTRLTAYVPVTSGMQQGEVTPA